MISGNHIMMKNESDFSHLITSVSNGDYEALERLRFVVSAMLKTWVKRERQEIRWIASGGKCLDQFLIVKDIIDRYLEAYSNNRTGNSFAEFREFTVKEFKEQINARFREFMKLLGEKNQIAWKIVYDDLQNRAAAWFYKRNHSLNEEKHSIFNIAIQVCYSKFIDNEFKVDAPVAFKSYFFRILENKVHESLKDNYYLRSVPFGEADPVLFANPDISESMEEDETKMLVSRALEKLNKDEYHILTDYFYGEKSLKEIALETKQTEENVRIKKFRALKKLNLYFKKTGYGT